MCLNYTTIKLFTTVFLSLLPLVTGEVVHAGTRVESFPNGNHRLCSKKPLVLSNGLVAEGGMCFLFRKSGNRVVGVYYEPNSDSGICVSGTVSNSAVRGFAVESVGGGSSLPSSNTPYLLSSELENWDTSGFLRVGGKSVRNARYSSALEEYQGEIYYNRALLNLNGFYRYNAGSASPPGSCK